MNSSPRATDLATVEDFYALVPDGQKADLLDGVIYVASPDTYAGDRLTNFFARLLASYCEAKESGVSEYWIVDPIKQRADFLVLEAGKYRSSELENGSMFRSRVLPGFFLDVRWLFGTKLPKVQPTLDQIWRG